MEDQKDRKDTPPDGGQIVPDNIFTINNQEVNIMQTKTLVNKEDRDFIATFLETYKGLNEDSRNLVLAFVRGMEFQRELAGERPRPFQ